MPRKHVHEDHANHEAWAIPYGDLITLLLAFFVVMYAISSVNEGKYRVLSDSLSEAFGGSPKTIKPITMGSTQVKGSERDRSPPMQSIGARGPVAPLPLQQWRQKPQVPRPQDARSMTRVDDRAMIAAAQAGLRLISDEIQEALGSLIDRDLVTVRRTELWVEVEIKSDILFASGVARPMTEAVDTLNALAQALGPFPNLIRIEGHTDNIPIATYQFPSNWELSSARAASVLHLFVEQGIEAERLTLIGNGEFRPIADNTTAEGRNANRRVLIVILAHLDEDALARLPEGEFDPELFTDDAPAMLDAADLDATDPDATEPVIETVPPAGAE
jgi:chemotaxis protein MotB